MAKLGVNNWDTVLVKTDFGEVVVNCAVSRDAPHEGTVFICKGPWANTIVSHDTYCCSDPTYKGIRCTVEKTDRKVLLMADLMRWVYKKYVDEEDDDVVENMESLGELPVYHGTSDGVLSVAVGHLQGSSLPVGGENTHCVVSAHRGLPTAVLFTHLDRMEIGDIFYFTILDRTITYEVDQIRIVEPDDASLLQIKDGKDYCTLLTCTPYGINTHRMLVRGTRIANLEEDKKINVITEAYQIDPLIVTPIAAIPLLAGFLIYLLISAPSGKKRKKKSSSDKEKSTQK